MLLSICYVHFFLYVSIITGTQLVLMAKKELAIANQNKVYGYVNGKHNINVQEYNKKNVNGFPPSYTSAYEQVKNYNSKLVQTINFLIYF